MRWLITSDRLPARVDDVFRCAERGECQLALPSICIADLIYVYEKAGGVDKIWDIFKKIEVYPSFVITPLDTQVLKLIPEVRLTELHDRIIAATTIILEAEALITKDKEIEESSIVKTIW
ncbi:MAG: type II toxin-antitoxin system VapC family toxin [Candidatus Bathyarchaeia archaeon]